MIWVVAEKLGVPYQCWVKLYQSRFYEDDFPEENKQFGNVVYLPAEKDSIASLHSLRTKMFSDQEFASAVFIGGMKGIIDEYEMITRQQKNVNVIPVLSTGGATLDLQIKGVPEELLTELNYVRLFHKYLNVSPRERRYSNPEAQPKNIESRFWERNDPK